MKFFLAVCAMLALSCGDPESGEQQRPSDLRRGPEAYPQADVADGSLSPTDAKDVDTDRVELLSNGQSLYVPVYSHVYHGPKAKQFNLACTLSIRNTDTRHQLVVSSVDYYDTEGDLVGHYLDEERVLAPLETTEFFIEERDVAGGSGANFVVRWRSTVPVNLPLVEAVMIGADAGQGISFVSQAREIFE